MGIRDLVIPCDFRPLDPDEYPLAAVSYMKGTTHKVYEDAFRILSRDIQLVKTQQRGEIFAVFDGIGGAVKGRQSAQKMADGLIDFYRYPDRYPATGEGLHRLIMKNNEEIYDWGREKDSGKTLGGCAGTICWIYQDKLVVCHAGDTMGILIRDEKILELTIEHQAPDGALIKFFGFGSELKMDMNQFKLEEGDQIILVSDGVTKALPNAPSIVQEIKNHTDIKQAVTHIVSMSLKKGSGDDITAMLIDFEEIWEDQE